MVAAYGLNGFVGLFLANGVSYLLYVAILVLVVREDARPEPVAGGYRVVIRDRAFVRLAVTNIAMIAVGWGVFTWIVPPFAYGELGAGSQLIGFLLFANALTVVFAQIPVARLSEGRRRAMTMAAAALTFVAGCLIVAGAGLVDADAAYAAVLVATIVVGVGECLYTTALMPLVADLAPPALRGRYMATVGLTWWLGLALAPTFGTQLLSVSPVGGAPRPGRGRAPRRGVLAVARAGPPRRDPAHPAAGTSCCGAMSGALVAALVTVTLWGSAFVAIRDAGETLSPGSIALGRLLVSLVVLGIAAWIVREPLPGRRDLAGIAAFGVLFLGVYSVTLNAAERRVDAGTAAMLINVGPILIAVLAGIFLREGFPRWLHVGCAVAFSGCVLIGLANSQQSSRAGSGSRSSLSPLSPTPRRS